MSDLERKSAFTPAPVPDGIVEVHGKKHMADAKGRLTPVELIKPQVLLEDEMVRREFGWILGLSDQIGRCRGHAYSNLDAFDALLDQEYNVKKGGPKGNKIYHSYDGLMRIEIRINDVLSFGSGLQQAKAIFDELLSEMAADSTPEIRMIINNAFAVDKTGQINRANLYLLLQTESDNPRWQEGQRAIRDAQKVLGAKEYIRFYRRESIRDGWKQVAIDLAAA